MECLKTVSVALTKEPVLSVCDHDRRIEDADSIQRAGPPLQGMKAELCFTANRESF